MLIRAVIQIFNGGKFGKSCEYIAIVRPAFFKNGKMKKTGFEEVQRLETIKKGYNFNNLATQSTPTIKTVLKVIEE